MCSTPWVIKKAKNEEKQGSSMVHWMHLWPKRNQLTVKFSNWLSAVVGRKPVQLESGDISSNLCNYVYACKKIKTESPLCGWVGLHPMVEVPFFPWEFAFFTGLMKPVIFTVCFYITTNLAVMLQVITCNVLYNHVHMHLWVRNQ